jgi:hypothetical protein
VNIRGNVTASRCWHSELLARSCRQPTDANIIRFPPAVRRGRGGAIYTFFMLVLPMASVWAHWRATPEPVQCHVGGWHPLRIMS